MVNRFVEERQRRKLPDFLCIGAQRSGTTWLYRHMSLHPQIWLPPIKELHYFSGLDKPLKRKINVYLRHLRVRVIDNIRDLFSLNIALLLNLVWDSHYFFGKRNDAWYLSLFRPSARQFAGEMSPDYAALNIEKIREIQILNPDLKIIYLMRDPIERSWSGATKDLARQRRRHIDTVPDNELYKKINGPGTMLRSNHLMVLEKWESIFGEEQFFIGFFDDVVDRPQELLQRIYRFLNISDSKEYISPDISNKVNSAGKYKSPIKWQFQVHLAKQQIAQLTKLSKRFGGPTNKWLRRAEEILAKADISSNH